MGTPAARRVTVCARAAARATGSASDGRAAACSSLAVSLTEAGSGVNSGLSQLAIEGSVPDSPGPAAAPSGPGGPWHHRQVRLGLASRSEPRRASSEPESSGLAAAGGGLCLCHY